MTSDKNNFLVATSKLAKKHGVSSLVAVAPVEHDLAYSEHDTKSWVELRAEAEATALAANKNLTILSSDLVFGSREGYLTPYIAQSAFAGKLPASFFNEAAKFSPIHYEDLARAIAHKLENAGHGQFAVRGEEELSIKQLVNVIEKACGKPEGHTKAKRTLPFEISTIIEEFFTGITHDTNMTRLIDTQASGVETISGANFWEASELSPEQKLSQFYRYHAIQELEVAAFPTFAAYKQVSLD